MAATPSGTHETAPNPVASHKPPHLLWWSIGCFMVNFAVDATTNKYGSSLPGALIWILWMIALVPFVISAIKHERSLLSRQWVVTKFKEHPISTPIIVLLFLWIAFSQTTRIVSRFHTSQGASASPKQAPAIVRPADQPLNPTSDETKAAAAPPIRQESRAPIHSHQNPGKAGRTATTVAPAGAGTGEAPRTAGINYAPGGFATSGGYLDHPTVINTRPRPPELDVSVTMTVDPQPIYPFNRHTGIEDKTKPQIGMTHPGTAVVVTLKGTFVNPAIVADCNVPCALSRMARVTNDDPRKPGDSFSDQSEFTPLASADRMSAGVSFTASQLFAGTRVELFFVSLDDRPLTTSNIRPYVP